jgi:hypothetical protein
LFVALLVLAAATCAGGAARADDATEMARSHYETGLELFYAREHAQALIEFQRAHEIKPRPATLFMMGQCEYLLGSLRQARDHYQSYLRESPTGEFVEVAKDRIESINRRPATLVINTVPDEVDVRVTAAGPPPSSTSLMPSSAPDPLAPVATGQAPNNFSVPRGRWAITVSKTNYQSQHVTIEVEVAETKPLFFKLEPIPARLEVETVPSGATLYINGNRALNPYRQNVPPGRFEVFAEAPDHQQTTTDFVLGPGDRRLFVGPNAFQLRYVQRSGRPELVFASAVMGGLIGAGAVAGTILAAPEIAGGGNSSNTSTVGFTLGGALAGTISGALVGNRFVPSYIPDNRALFVIGGMWIGAAEGALTGMSIRQAREHAAVDPDPLNANLSAYRKPAPLSAELQAAFFGSLPGLAVGVTSGALMMNHAPTYGRVSLIQSAAIGGAAVGALTAVALRWNPYSWQQVSGLSGQKQLEDSSGHSILDLSLPALIGLNVGLAGGLLGAYLPDQSRYGPSWQRVALIDLAAGAGALATGIFACGADSQGCLTSNEPASGARARTAALALLGGGVGLIAGIVLTRNVDQDIHTTTSTAPLPVSLTLLPARTARGGLAPTVSAVGFF